MEFKIYELTLLHRWDNTNNAVPSKLFVVGTCCSKQSHIIFIDWGQVILLVSRGVNQRVNAHQTSHILVYPCALGSCHFRKKSIFIKNVGWTAANTHVKWTCQFMLIDMIVALIRCMKKTHETSDPLRFDPDIAQCE